MIRFIQNKYQPLIQVLTWVGLTAVHFIILTITELIPWQLALVDAIVFNSVFGLITVGLWFLVNNNDLLRKLTFDKIITHLSIFVISITLWLFLSTHLLRSIYSDNKAYVDFLEKSFNIRILVGVIYYKLNLLFFYLVKTIQQLNDKEIHEKHIHKLLKDAELEALKTQINPHFLFNSLNSINALTRSNPEKASEMILKLSDYMRYSLNQSGETLTTLLNEMNNIEKYLDIEKIRFGNKLSFSLEITQDCLPLKLPIMLLQPLFENAIKHGLYSVSEGFYIHVHISCLNKVLVIEIENNYDSKYPSKDRHGVGLNNVKNRLLNIYGRSDLFIIEKENDIFKVRLNIPQYE